MTKAVLGAAMNLSTEIVPASFSSSSSTISIEKIFVESLLEIETTPKYRDIIRKQKNDTLFVLKDSGTFLLLKGKDIDEINDIDKVAANSFWNPLAPKAKTSEWVEFKPNDLVRQTYPGFIPVSSCQSQENGQSGSISFGYSLGAEGKVSGSKVNGINYWFAALDVVLQVDIKETVTYTGSTTCKVNEGTIGQVLSKPTYAEFKSIERIRTWSDGLSHFIGDAEFQTTTAMVTLLIESDMYCATNDVVDLFCDSKLGEPNWESPLGVDYDTREYYNTTNATAYLIDTSRMVKRII
ncbi:hypothetical protein CAAN1_27S01112 [[Candida] anglica]|uniref:Uncharacterized protein n=1 Tax=[Candida] anglica TaxID=148631 RepID=A0ABP0E917_9ASCO